MPMRHDLIIVSPGSYLIHLFGVRFYSGQAELQSSIREQLCRSCSEYTTIQSGVVGVERSRDQTKMAERLNGIETSTNISFKQGSLTGIVSVRPFPVLSRYQTRNCYFPCS